MKAIKTLQVFVLFVASLAVTMPVLAAGEGMTQKGVAYVRILTGANGESHFEEGEFPFDFLRLASGEEAGMYNIPVSGNATMMMIAPGAFEDWHPTPNEQTLVVIQGEVEVGVSDGELRRFTPGMVIVMQDSSGKGHTTRTVGDIPHIAMLIPRTAD